MIKNMKKFFTLNIIITLLCAFSLNVTAEDATQNLLTEQNLNMKKGWVLKEGTLEVSKTPGGMVWSKNKYADFELSLEYKTSEQCNSGVFFRSNPKNPVQGGFEIQVASDGKYSGKHIVGSLFDAKEASTPAGKPDGEWNKMVITCQGSKVKVVLNDKEVLNIDLNDWNTAKKNPDGSKNKFKTALKDLPRTGHIGFQYHGQPVWYRNVKIKKLK